MADWSKAYQLGTDDNHLVSAHVVKTTAGTLVSMPLLGPDLANAWPNTEQV